MRNQQQKNMILSLLEKADIGINGKEPWDIQIHNEHFYTRVLRDGPLGLGETYMDKWWDCSHLDSFFDRLLRARLHEHVKVPLHFYFKLLFAKFFNFQSLRRAKQVAHHHYDLGNTLFTVMLDKYMQYSCGYWKSANTLDEAQLAKMELICQKLQLKPGLSLLDIGCGWGGLANYAAEKYGVRVVGITLSEQQQKYAIEFCKDLPVEIKLMDYRKLTGQFDRIVSVGMFEHVGYKNYATYMRQAHRLLKENGLFLLHTIGADVSSPLANEWILKYIFPNGMLPTIAQIAKPTESLFVMEDWQNFGAYYDKTLMAWYDNFVQHWDRIKANYDERFLRMWRYYLLACAGDFRARANQLWQIVFSKNGVMGGYMAPR